MYIGDLPITLTSRSDEKHSVGPDTSRRYITTSKRYRLDRGASDSVFRFTALPRDAVFGGLVLTAEPARYVPIVNEPLRPLLITLTPERVPGKDASPK